jgi:hypothetical protein
VLFRSNASGGYVHSVQVEKVTFRQTTGGSGVGSTAANVVTNTANFDGALSTGDTTVQAALDTLDDKVGINALTAKTTPVDADMLGLMDSAASNVLKKLSWSNVKATFLATVMTWSAKQTFNGFTVLGDAGPSIKTKKLTGTTGSSEGAEVSQAHGLTASKIISVTAKVESGGFYYTPGSTRSNGYQFDVYWGGYQYLHWSTPDQK